MDDDTPSSSFQWRPVEDLNYFFSLILQADILEIPNKKQSRIYEKIAKLMGNKCNKQCRTHHAKKIKNLKGISKTEMFIYRCYHSYYKIRKLGEGKLKEQVGSFIDDCRERGRITKDQHSHYMNKLDFNIRKLNLEQNCLLSEGQSANASQRSIGGIQQQSELRASRPNSDMVFQERMTEDFDNIEPKEFNDIDSYLD